MPIGDPMHPRMSWILLVFWLSLSCFPGLISSAVVTLKSIEIYKTHEMLKSVKPVVYFRCKGENKTELPDVKKPNEVYNFKGEESWQPLTNLANTKCKRCGFYELDSFIKSDDIFDEWEFCPSDFPHGIYTRIKEKEMNATFTCPQCIPLATASETAPDSRNEGKGMHVFLVILIVMVVSTVIIFGMVAVYKYWQKRKRQQDQARFLKLFEDGDDIEDELGLDNVI